MSPAGVSAATQPFPGAPRPSALAAERVRRGSNGGRGRSTSSTPRTSSRRPHVRPSSSPCTTSRSLAGLISPTPRRATTTPSSAAALDRGAVRAHRQRLRRRCSSGGVRASLRSGSCASIRGCTRAVPGHAAAGRRYVGADRYVLFIGQIEPRKNLPRLVRAFFERVADADPDLRLVLAGPPGPDTDNVERAVTAGPHGTE